MNAVNDLDDGTDDEIDAATRALLAPLAALVTAIDEADLKNCLLYTSRCV